MGAQQADGLSQAEPEVSALRASIPSADHDPYWDYEENECWNCGGEGFVYGCSWEWQCDTWDEGEMSCLCSRRCEFCNPSKPTPNNHPSIIGESK